MTLIQACVRRQGITAFAIPSAEGSSVRVAVEFDDVARTQGTLTIVPSWLGRLFGRRARVARIKFVTYLGWRYDVDGDWIGTDLEKIVNQQRRWQEIRGVPPARVVVSHRSDR